MFSKIGSIILLVDDMERSTQFYKDTLGLQLKGKTTDWIEFLKRELRLHCILKKEKVQMKKVIGIPTIFL
jgi:lactoylglutathione lyase